MGRESIHAGTTGYCFLLTALLLCATPLSANSSPERRAYVDILVLKDSVAMFYADTGAYPKTLVDLVQDPGIKAWDGPYPDKLSLQDPWGEEYHYEYPGRHGDFDIYSYGRDKRPGGTKSAMDITSWGPAPPVPTYALYVPTPDWPCLLIVLGSVLVTVFVVRRIGCRSSGSN